MYMSKRKKSTTPTSKDVLLIFGTVADTTWRLFVPTLGGVLLGIWADKTYLTRPLWTILGVSCGTIISLYLVYKQLQGVKNKR